MKKYCIVNEFDKPYPRLVTQIVDGKHYYMMRSVEKNLKSYDGMTPKSPNFLEDFGFEIVEREYQVDFKQVRSSTAKYNNGTLEGEIRPWQGEKEFSLPKVIL